MTASALVISGAGRYADPWHDFAGTSARLAQLLGQAGLDTQVATLGEADPPGEPVDLLVVNAGGGSTPRPVEDTPSDARGEALAEWVRQAVAAGTPLLATHTASNTFYDDGRWAGLLGGRWIPGTSWHPPMAPATVQVTAAAHPITAGMSELSVNDERYCDQELLGEVDVLVDHAEDGRRHPIVWAQESGAGRVVYDGLGHDRQAYDGADRQKLLMRELDWLLHRI